MSLQFKRLPKSLLNLHSDQHLLDAVAKQIAKQVEFPPDEINLDRLIQSPPQVQTIYWLWLFQCEAGTAGIEVLVLNSLGKYLPQIHKALETVGARELVHRLEAAVPHAREAPAEFKLLPNRSWFNKFKVIVEYPTLQSVDVGVFPIIRALTNVIAAFIKSNKNILFEDE